MSSNRIEHDYLEEAAKRLISLAEAAKMSGLSPSHLRHLVRRGMIWGQKIGRNWVTTEQAVKEYQGRGIRPGPKPRDGAGGPD